MPYVATIFCICISKDCCFIFDEFIYFPAVSVSKTSFSDGIKIVVSSKDVKSLKWNYSANGLICL